MNQDLAQIVIYYATKPHKELSELLLNKSKDNLNIPSSGFIDGELIYV